MVSYLIAGVIVLTVVVVLMQVAGRAGKKKSNPKANAAKLIRDASRKLKQNPHDAAAMTTLADYYYGERNFEKAAPLYDSLIDLVKLHHSPNEFQVALRQGICAIKLDKIQEAFKGLSDAYKFNPNDYEVNYNLGMACYKSNMFDKAVPCLRKAVMARPDTSEPYGPLGACLYKTGKFSESIKFLKKFLDEHPGDKETLFNLADAMYQSGHGDKAMKVFLHLRPDPKYGPQSCLIAGSMHFNNKLYDKAIQDFEIGLKHADIPIEVQTELLYKMAASWFALNKMSNGLDALKKIQALVPNYKDVPQLVARYTELNQNTNLQVYLSAGTSDFVALCRKIVSSFYPNSFVKVIDISVTPENSEILCNVSSSKWEDTEVFRFYRSTGVTGELYVRDFHARIRDTKADRGVCFTAGHFSEEGKKYIEGRPIDLYEKEKLVKILKKLP